MKDIGIVIRYKRQMKGLAQATLALRADIPQQKLSAIERGLQKPSAEDMRNLRLELDDDLAIPDAAELRRMEKVAPRQAGRVWGAGPGRDPDAARSRWIAYWGQFDACPQSYCKALPKMPCKQDHHWSRTKRMADKACALRPKLKETT